jgi:hypothetical protein
MKNIFFLVCAAMLVICSPACQKDDPPEEPQIDPVIVSSVLDGTWELRESLAAGQVNIFTYAPGTGETLKFVSGKYEKYEKGVLAKKGSYTITADTTVSDNVCLVLPAGSYPNRITYDNNLTKPKSFFEIKDGRLIFISGCYAFDAGRTETYARLK